MATQALHIFIYYYYSTFNIFALFSDILVLFFMRIRDTVPPQNGLRLHLNSFVLR